MTRPAAIVMNMFYTGLGIARNLGEHRVPVIGLTSRRGIYGNYTRHAQVRSCPDSREEPQALLSYLLRMGEAMAEPAVIFPTRDDDVLFLDLYRESLSRYFTLTIPRPEVVTACLDKWETYRWARQADVATPRCWQVDNYSALLHAVPELTFPCVMKPVSAHLWRKHGNWERVGGRKAIEISSPQALLAEYAAISLADPRVLLQEIVPGGDDQLFVAACYLDAESNFVAGFTARKLLQVPAGFGTGCIVESIDLPELLEPAARILRKMNFTGIAEVEFKRDPFSEQYKLIEINPRSWDQHTLGKSCGRDLVYMAYCGHTGTAMPAIKSGAAGMKWIAEDVFFTSVLRMIWRREDSLRSHLRLAQGNRTFAIWSANDPMPFIGYLLSFLPKLAWMAIRSLGHSLTQLLLPERPKGRQGTSDGKAF